MSEKTRTGNPGLFLAFFSTFSYCVLNVGTRAFTDAGLTVWTMMTVRGAMFLLVVIPVARVWGKKPLGRNRPLLAAIGFCTFVGALFSASAITMIPLYQALVLAYLYPSMSLLQSMVINKTPVDRRDLALLAAAFGGCLVLVWPDSAAGLRLGPGHLLAVAGAFCFGLAFVLTNKLGDENSGLEPTFYYGLWAVLGGLGLMLFMGENPAGVTAVDLGRGALLGAMAVVPIATSYAALRWLPSHRLGIIGTLEVFGGALCSWLIFHDPITIRAVFGGLMILFAALRLRA